MCILFIHTDPSPPKDGYRIIVATNRDEYYSRPAQNAFQEKDYIGGRDMEPSRESGMWFGVSSHKSDDYKFRVACILNVTGEDHSNDAEGRGAIVLNYLKDNVLTEDYSKTLAKHSYNAYNFVTIELSNEGIVTHHQSNRPVSSSRYDGKQILGFGNSTTSVPLQKVVNGKQRFEDLVRLHSTDSKDELIEQLTQLLRHEQRYLPDAELQRRSPAFEHLSSIYVKFLEAKYGTRTHTIVLVDYDWNVDFVEITMEQPIKAEDPVWNTSHFKERL